jgi:hypothetical protein
MDELAQFIDAQSNATQETLLLVDAGLKKYRLFNKQKKCIRRTYRSRKKKWS